MAYNQTVNFTPYDEQMAEIQRRQRMAELMQQQAIAPLETPQSGGRMIARVSPLAGLAKMLQAYAAGKEFRDIEKQRGAAEETARTQAMDWLKGFQPSVGVSPDAALQAATTPIARPNDVAANRGINYAMGQSEAALGLEPGTLGRGSEEATVPVTTPAPQQQVTALSPTERQNRLYQGALSANPYTAKLASVLMAQKQPTAPIKELDPKDWTPASLAAYRTNFARTGVPDESVLVPKEEKTTLPSIERKTRTSFDARGNEIHQDYNFNPKTGEETLVGKPYSGKPKTEGTGAKETAEGLRKEFTGQTSQYRSVADAYQKIEKAAANPSAANDIALIYGYMRINDPTSTVREGEFATAQNAAGVPEQIRNLYNKVRSGTRLSPEQRNDFVDSAYGMVESQRPNIETLSKRYADIATRSGLNPSDIVYDPFESIKKRKPPAPPAGFQRQGSMP